MGIVERLYRVVRSKIRNLTDREEPGQFADPQRWAGGGENGVPKQSAESQLAQAGYFANLELPNGSSFAEVRSAYRRLQRKYHPDRHWAYVDKAATAEEIAKGLNEAMSYFEAKHAKGEMS